MSLGERFKHLQGIVDLDEFIGLATQAIEVLSSTGEDWSRGTYLSYLGVSLYDDMSRITYGEVLRGGMTDESVCLGLHRATREL